MSSINLDWIANILTKKRGSNNTVKLKRNYCRRRGPNLNTTSGVMAAAGGGGYSAYYVMITLTNVKNLDIQH